MAKLHNVTHPNGKRFSLDLPGIPGGDWDVQGRLCALPAAIDPHVHFRTPGSEHKENWQTGAAAALAGGVTTVFDMPNTRPACVTSTRLHEKVALIKAQLHQAGLPLKFRLYLGADRHHLDEIPLVKDEVVGLKIFMGSSTGDLLMDDVGAMKEAFQVAADCGLLVAVHAEDEATVQRNQKAYSERTDAAVHSLIRDRSAALKATAQAVQLAKDTGARLIVLHMSTKDEIEVIRQAKSDGVKVYAEVTPHHLFLSQADYVKQGTRVQMNPPLRERADQDVLWEALMDGTIDTLGSDHAPHLLHEKDQPYGEAPSGVPGTQTLLPLMIDVCNRGDFSFQRLQQITKTNIERIYGLPSHNDWVLVDLDLERVVQDRDMRTRCAWSPYSGRKLRGWPVLTCVRISETESFLYPCLQKPGEKNGYEDVLQTYSSASFVPGSS